MRAGSGLQPCLQYLFLPPQVATHTVYTHIHTHATHHHTHQHTHTPRHTDTHRHSKQSIVYMANSLSHPYSHTINKNEPTAKTNSHNKEQKKRQTPCRQQSLNKISTKSFMLEG